METEWRGLIASVQQLTDSTGDLLKDLSIATINNRFKAYKKIYEDQVGQERNKKMHLDLVETMKQRFTNYMVQSINMIMAKQHNIYKDMHEFVDQYVEGESSQSNQNILSFSEHLSTEMESDQSETNYIRDTIDISQSFNDGEHSNNMQSVQSIIHNTEEIYDTHECVDKYDDNGLCIEDNRDNLLSSNCESDANGMPPLEMGQQHVIAHIENEEEDSSEVEISQTTTRRKKQSRNAEEIYSCYHCPKKYMTTKEFQEHNKKEHKDSKPWHCHYNGCNHSSKNKTCFTRHIERVHEKISKFKCDQCPKGFYDKHKLENHLRTHSGEKPFECDQCDKKFAQKYHVTRHINIVHKKIKNYKCKYCGKKFAQKQSMTQHTRIHTGEKPYQCNKCDKRFMRNADCKKHQRECKSN